MLHLYSSFSWRQREVKGEGAEPCIWRVDYMVPKVCPCVAPSQGSSLARLFNCVSGLWLCPFFCCMDLGCSDWLQVCKRFLRASGRYSEKKDPEAFQPSPGYWTGFQKLQEEDLQVSSENDVSPPLQFFWQPLIVLRLVVSQDFQLRIVLPMRDSNWGLHASALSISQLLREQISVCCALRTLVLSRKEKTTLQPAVAHTANMCCDVLQQSFTSWI